jgi:CRP-like cAMP-binding protein
MTDELRSLPLFGSLTDEEADRLAAEAAEVSVTPGDPLFPGFEPTRAFWVLIEGRWRVVRRVAGREDAMFEADRPGTWTGGVPLIDAIAPVRAEVLAPSRFLAVPIPTMHALAATNPGVARRLLEAIEWGARRIGGPTQQPATA